MKHLILASKSPRRKELLTQLGVAHKAVPAEKEERIEAGMSPEEAVRTLAQQKAEEVAARFPDALVLGADTVVAINGTILGKPRDRAEAASMLRTLSGHTHTVYTGVAIAENGQMDVFVSGAAVTFYQLDEADISWYTATGEPDDKAGAYGIQGLGAVLVEKIEGDYSAVVGLPAAKVFRALKKRGYV
ncbi:Maf family protein [Alkalicoccus luteus]|uniref:dTTP/UTP pyrophosphatase n=1 Tax=Alkalicoccus luteus TaxID=1237094 RepID=A0A969TU72_9BACI|nr:Maf family protein [Alkalicoccus luteus]NJP36757.1 septum formation inhibitor Maf [Alkalicoccus luteus]